MTTTSRVYIFSLALAVLGIVPIRGTTIIPIDSRSLIDQSRIIFVGTAVHEEVALTGDRSFPFTLITFKVEESLKGSAANQELTVAFPGGPLGEDLVAIEGAPEIAVGEKYLLFLSGNGVSSFPIVGWSQGKMRFARDPLSGAEILVDAKERHVVGLNDHQWVLSSSDRLDGNTGGTSDALRSSTGVKILPLTVPPSRPAAPASQALAQLRVQIRQRANQKTFLAGSQVSSARASDLPFSLAGTPSPLNTSSRR